MASPSTSSQIGSPPNRKIHPQSGPPQSQRKQLPAILFWLMAVGILELQFSNYLRIKFFSGATAIFIVTAVISVVPNLIVTCWMGKNCKEICFMYFLLDGMMVLFFVVALGTIGLMLIINPTAAQVIFGVFTVLFYFIFVGTFRILLRNCFWKKYQIITTKIILLLGCCGYIVYAGDIIILQGGNQTLKEFIFINCFGLFSIVYEIFSKLSQLDGTSQFSYRYCLKEEEESVEIRGVEQIRSNENMAGDNAGTRINLESVIPQNL